jgi:hypothetical protein
MAWRRRVPAWTPAAQQARWRAGGWGDGRRSPSASHRCRTGRTGHGPGFRAHECRESDRHRTGATGRGRRSRDGRGICANRSRCAAPAWVRIAGFSGTSRSTPCGRPSTWASIQVSSVSNCSGVHPDAPKPPGRLTEATTSRQWLNARRGIRYRAGGRVRCSRGGGLVGWAARRRGSVGTDWRVGTRVAMAGGDP